MTTETAGQTLFRKLLGERFLQIILRMHGFKRRDEDEEAQRSKLWYVSNEIENCKDVYLAAIEMDTTTIIFEPESRKAICLELMKKWSREQYVEYHEKND